MSNDALGRPGHETRLELERARPVRRFALPVVALLAAAAAVAVLVTQPGADLLDYGLGLVPGWTPWVAAGLAVATAAAGPSARFATSPAGMLLGTALVVATGWSAAMLLFDLLRVVRLVPLPVDGGGLVLRLLLVVAAATALIPVVNDRSAALGRCPACRRVLPGRLARVPRWPLLVAVLFALPYPVMRTSWVLGGGFGTTGGELDVAPALQWTMAAVGWLLVAFTVVLLTGRGPGWLRALLGIGGMVAGGVLAATFGPAAVGTALALVRGGTPGAPELDLAPWVPLLFYGSWLVCGVFVAIGSWRCWSHRREICPECGPLLVAR